MVCIDGLERPDPKTQTQGKEQITDQYWSQARGLAAATMVVKTIRNLKAHGQLGQCTGFLLVTDLRPSLKVLLIVNLG